MVDCQLGEFPDIAPVYHGKYARIDFFVSGGHFTRPHQSIKDLIWHAKLAGEHFKVPLYEDLQTQIERLYAEISIGTLATGKVNHFLKELLVREEALGRLDQIRETMRVIMQMEEREVPAYDEGVPAGRYRPDTSSIAEEAT